MSTKIEQTKFKVALIQMSMSDDVDENISKAASWIDKAANEGGEVICLPELFSSHYFCQKEDIKYFNLAESIPGKTTKLIGEIAKRRKIIIIAPLFEKRAPGIYHNSLVVIGNTGDIIGLYRKMHIPDDPAFYEKFYFTPGDLGFKSFKTSVGNIGTLICWDQWYPEAARITAMMGASILLYPTAIGWHPHEKLEHGKAQFDSWQTIQKGHAIANGIYVAAVNRIGLEKLSDETAGIEFWGSSFIADPQGIIIAQASTDKEEIIFADVDLSRIEYVRQNWPFFRDRRVDEYEKISKRFLDEDSI
ncbi:MAG TPA: carbon-nitrogen hydrolase [Ignavibacteriaceae bacterium]|nr:carbon-nitrogen hydrolase [Ignavibacteriaceae bacterium]